MNDQDYNVEFVEPPPSECDCPVCFDSFKDKVCFQTTCCGNHICSDCATRLQNMGAPCSQCRGNFDATKDQFFTRQFLSLKVRCYFSNAGCKWSGELRQLDEHKINCAKKLVKCQYCNKNYHQSNINEHLLICCKASIIITCPNCCSNQKQRRDTIEAHLENECPLRIILPPNGALPITADGETSIVPVSFTMLDYLKHLQSGHPWYSPPFYTRESGYKLSIRVDAKLDEKSNHLSVHACILKGEYDHQLQWPLHAEVNVSLLNWRDITKSLYLPGDEYCKQVLVDKIGSLGKGVIEFASNEDVELILNENMQEFSSECLSFRVESVRILPMPQVIPEWAKHNCITYFVVNSLNKLKKQECKEFFGPSFYTQANGYKIEISVKLLPNYDETGTDVYVTARVVEREHNNSVWPFYGILGINLINWKKDKYHKHIKIKFDECNQSDVVQSSFGILKFEEYSQLLYNSFSDAEYLHNDSLLFKVAMACTHQFALDNFTTQKLNHDFYYTRPFFASGYKMQISVEVNDNGYIGVYAYLMKSPNDNRLMWPFCGDVIVELVNLIEDKNHHKYVIKLSPEEVNGNVCDRVLVGDSNNGWGTPQFIQHSSIMSHFLQDDCLYFRVKEVVVYSNELSLKTPIWQNCQSLSPLGEFTVTNVSKRREYDTTFYSPAFLSHKEGYKLCLELHRSSDEESIGIYTKLLRGQNDDNLVWPFQASIVVELVNWREDANHHSHTISYYERTSIECKSQVTEGEQSLGLGTSTFISYSSLDYNCSKNTEYLQDDCLRLRIKEISVYSTSLCTKKPLWLEEAAKSFTVTCFSDRFRLQDIYWSPPFYTSARGYKMCLNMCPAGNGTGKGTHVSLFCYLMKGDYDDKLNWPFTADVVVDLINWRGDHNHHREVFEFNDDSSDDARARVRDNNEVAPKGCGSQKFIELSTLFSSSFDTAYILQDCMCMRVHDIAIYKTKLLSKMPCWKHHNSNSALEFNLINFTRKSSYEYIYYSKPFFSSGYKMQISVQTNVNGCIAVSVHLMNGPNDDKLIWPFCGDVVVELVNWIENNNHHRFVIELSPEVVTNNVCDRVMAGDSNDSWGTPQFIQHSSIKSQFLQDDCLYFRVKEVVVHSTQLSIKNPNLEYLYEYLYLLPAYEKFTITNVSKRSEYNTTFYSSAFHSHNGGYKLRLEIKRSLDEHHIGIYAKLLRGQHDGNLVWPFQGSIVVELVNWRKDANHYSYTISFSEHTPIQCKSRVTEGQQSLCLGTGTFISYSSLDYNSSTNTEYLQDDCLRLRIKEIAVFSTPACMKKPHWLEEAVNFFTVTCFSDRIRLQVEYWSPPFYTCARGYRMCLKVCPVAGPGKGTHVSLFAYLMKGDYDDEINWPFTADVVVDILNWKREHTHHRVVFKINEDSPDSARARVYDDNKVAPKGCSSQKFEISTLMSYSSDTKYLFEDCMCIKIHDVAIYNTELLNMTPCWMHNNLAFTSVTEFVLNKFTLRISYKNEYYSKPFFTSGYRMQIKVKANVIGYIGMYVHLMKGPNDNELMWPFCADVVVDLVNWREDKDHYRQVIELSPKVVTNNACDRVLVGDRSKGWGKHQFIQHLCIKPQFLQDDCLYFRVKEVVLRSNVFTLKRPNWQNSQHLSLFIEFTLPNASEQMKSGIKFSSPSFFTCIGGYMMCLEVQKSSDQQHIGMYAKLLREPNSHDLIQVSILVELVNWREDANHHSHTIFIKDCFFNQGDIVSSRLGPWGTETFIPFSSLSYKH